MTGIYNLLELLLFDYDHKNVPLLPCFLPVIAARLTTRSQWIYQWGNIKKVQFYNVNDFER